MATFSANIELLYSHIPSFEDRIQAAAYDGFKHVELWMSSSQDVKKLATVAEDHGVTFTSILAEPRFNFTFPGADFSVFFKGLDASIASAKILGSPRIVLGSGIGFPGMKRSMQLKILGEIFREANDVAMKQGISLVLEPVNTRVDHPGALLDRTIEAVQIVEMVDSPNFKILYDVYHSSIEGEDPVEVISKFSEKIGYIQIADTPGRHEPGSGDVDWESVFTAITLAGYFEPIGLEFYPSADTTSCIKFLESFK